MPKFQYTAASQQGKSLNGVIEADGIDSARKKLSSLKLSILSLEEIKSENLEQNSFLKYKFEAINKDNKKVVGTIASQSLISAFQKLITEYDLKIQKLASLNASESEFNQSASKIEQLYAQTTQLNSNLQNDNSNIEYTKEKQKAEFLKLIEETITIIRTIKTNHSENIKPEALEFLAKYEDHLNKIKFSDNIENIANAAIIVLKHLQESEMFQNIGKTEQEQIDLQMNFLSLTRKIKTYKKKENELISTISKLLEKVGIQLQSSKSSSSQKSTLDYLSLLFKTKSSQIRKLALLEFFKSIFDLFDPEKSSSKNQFLSPTKFKLSKIETELLSLTYWCIAILGSFYFVSVFVSQKIPKVGIPPILAIYNTKFIIYIITGILLLHASIQIRKLLISKNFEISKISYPLFGFLYILIVLNL